jgi:DNA-binding transcriptional MerR regulator
VPDPNPIPDKRFFKASEVCQITDTQPYVLRFWQSEFPQLRPERGVYRREDVDLVLRIKQLLYEEEFTIDGARRQLEQEQGEAAEAVPREVVAGEPAAEPADDRRSISRPGEAGALEVHGASALGDTVPRGRYDDAVEEVADLRLKLQEAETQARRAEARARKAEEVADRQRQRAHSALSRLEKLLESLD